MAASEVTGSYTGMASRADSRAERLIDLRSDTVTEPCEGMRQAMANALVGDDVYGEDPSINALQQQVAQLLGKPKALFFPTGTMSNLAALLSHCQRGEEVLVGDQYHIYRDEACGASVLGGIAMQSLITDQHGAFSEQQLLAAIKPDDPHCPISRLLCLENTVAGQVQPQAHIERLCDIARDHQLACHLDGARLLHAAIAQDKPPVELAAPFDSVSLCLSKGLGAPLGSVLAGSEELIGRALRWRKMLGGGMRQAGVAAAAALFALESWSADLQQDHRRARALAEGLAAIDEVELPLDQVQSNMLFIRAERAGELQAFLAERGALIGGQQPASRLVVHRQVSDQDIQQLLALFREFYHGA